MKALEGVERAFDQKQFDVRHELELAVIEEELVTLRAAYDRLTGLYTRPQIAVHVAPQRSDVFTEARMTEPDGTRIIAVSDVTEFQEQPEELPKDTRNEIDAKILELRVKEKYMKALPTQDDTTKEIWLRKSIDNYFQQLLVAYMADGNQSRDRHAAIVVNTNEQALLALVLYPDLCPSYDSERKKRILEKFTSDQKKILRADTPQAAITMIHRARRLGLIPLAIDEINGQERRLHYFLTTLPTDS